MTTPINFLYMAALKGVQLILVGAYQAGKTWLLYSYLNELEKAIHQRPTCGIDIIPHTITIDGRDIDLCLFETSGDERFEMITLVYYKNISGFLLVFDLTNKQSFDKAFSKWLNYILKHGKRDADVILVGTKCDLKNKRAISRERAQIMADELGMRYIETSSQTRYNVDLVFETLARDVIARVKI